MQGFGLPAAVDHVRLGQVPERSGLEQVVQGRPGPGEHDEVGLHEPAVHLHPVGVLAGEFLVDGPDGVAALLVEAVGLQDHLVKAVGLVGDPLQVETALRVHHDVKPRRPLVAEHDRPRRRFVGEKLAVPQELGPAGDRREAVARGLLLAQFRRPAEVADEPADDRALPGGESGVDLSGKVARCTPGRAGIRRGDEGQAVVAGESGHLPAQGRAVEEIALPGAHPAGPQRVFVHPAGAQLPLDTGSTGLQDLLELAVGGHAVDPGPQGVEPAGVESAETVPVAGEVQGYRGGDLVVLDAAAQGGGTFHQPQLNARIREHDLLVLTRLGRHLLEHPALVGGKPLERGTPHQPAQHLALGGELADLHRVPAMRVEPQFHEAARDDVPVGLETLIDRRLQQNLGALAAGLLGRPRPFPPPAGRQRWHFGGPAASIGLFSGSAAARCGRRAGPASAR